MKGCYKIDRETSLFLPGQSLFSKSARCPGLFLSSQEQVSYQKLPRSLFPSPIGDSLSAPEGLLRLLGPALTLPDLFIIMSSQVVTRGHPHTRFSSAYLIFKG